jgi:peroxiredoxin Q/BCP
VVNPKMLRIETASRLGDEVLTNLQALIGAATLADGHEPLGEHKFLRIQRGDDLANAVLAFDGDRLAGYAHTLTYATADERRTSCEIVVHPECRGLGVGRSLLAGVVDAARDQHARRVDLWAYNHSPLRSGAAQDAGFRPVRKLMHLHRHMRKLPRVEPRDGVVVRTFRPGSDEAPWLYLNRRVFEAHPDQAHWTGEDLRARMAQPWFEPADLLHAERDGEIVDYNWVKIDPRETEGRVGEIYFVGVAPECFTMHGAKGSPVPTKLTEGSPAPDFTLENDKGESVSLSGLRGNWTVLYWYPKDDTPGCTVEACEIRDNWQLLSGEAALFGVSPDDVKSHQKFRDKFSLPFPLLADPDHQVSESYGVWGQKKFMGREYMGVDRATFIIDPAGKIARIFPAVKPAGHSLEILQALQELKKAK